MLLRNLSLPRKTLPFLLPPNPDTIHRLLSASTQTLPSLLRHHAIILISGHSTNPSLAAKLISLYSSFRRPDLSSLVFHTLTPSPPDTFLWNSLIKAHFSTSNFPLSLHLYSRMRPSGAPPNGFTIPMVASACAELLFNRVGACVHAASISFGLFGGGGVGVGSSLVYMYAKCGAIGDARKVFDEMSERDVVSWTALIVGCVRNGECGLGLGYLKEMHRFGWEGRVMPNSRTVEGGLQACVRLGALSEAMCIHGLSHKVGIECSTSVKSLLLSVYSKCGSLGDAVMAFSELPEKDVVSWTAVVGVYARNGDVSKCLEMFRAMQDSSVEADEVLFSCMLAGFSKSMSVFGGKAFHGILLRKKIVMDPLVVNSLLTMYCKFELLDAAERVFYMSGEEGLESWKLMVSEYGKAGSDTKCLDLFRKMQFIGLGLGSGLGPDFSCLVPVISSCSKLGALHLGQSVHCYMMKSATETDSSSSNALIGMYGRCGRIDLAKTIFDQNARDVVTWNALIAAYTNLGYSNDALSLFDQMLLGDVIPNSTTFMSVLSACSSLAALQRGKWIHNYIKEMRLECDVSLGTALADMYAKCGQLELSRQVFDSMPERDVVSWNVMISGYGIHGFAKEALDVFGEMERMGVRPNGVTFLALLSACSHTGLLDEGRNLFARMQEYSVVPSVKHYACMVDLLGRSGNLHEAETMVLTMPMIPDGGIWGTMLGACRMHNNIEMGESIASKAFESDPENDGYYILMSNMYSCVGRWEDVKMLRTTMKERGVRKAAGWSSLELGDQIHVFTVGDVSNLQSEELYTVLEVLCRQVEERYYDRERSIYLKSEIN